ncbi:MAG: PAS domain-containing sensor histidine kinase, partial [Bacteroidetes bacterium]|nr:PAS domain-containing sensor histidine kinase [Bacteroidota bacterium]
SPRKGQFATAFTDITEKKIASEILRTSEERYRKISSTISDVAYSCVEGKEGAYSLDWMTGGVEQVSGYSADEIMAKKCWMFLVFEDDLKLFRKKVTGLEPGKSGVAELRIKRKDGSLIWIESRAECVLEPDGHKRLYGGIIDITDRKNAENVIKETENFFSMVFRGSPNAMLVTSAKDNKIVDVNDVFLNDLGYSRDDIIGNTSKNLNLFVDYSVREKLMTQVMEKGFARNFELMFRTKTGEHLPVLVSMTLIHRQGEPYLLSNIANLSDIKTAEDKLRKSEEKYRRLHESITDAVAVVDMQGNIIEWNNAYREMMGYSDDEIKKLTYFELTPVKWHDVEDKIVNEKTIPLGDSGVYQKEYIRKDGTIFPIELRTYLIKDDEGKPSAMWAVIRDITERKQFEGALIAAKEKAEEMNRLKSNFLANMSHELRTPMTGILGFSEMLSEELEDADRKQMAEVIYQGGKRLMNTLNLILNLSKLESETLTASLSNVNLSELAVSSVRMYELLASGKNLKLVVDVDNDVCADLDEQFASQVIGNLVQNAIIYTNQGFVSVTLKRETSDSGNFAVLRVKDTGIGIKKEHQQIIFEPFRQVSEGFNRSYEGTGLGLTITKKYVELMNGSISVESEPGKGTVFTVKFPLLDCKIETQNNHTKHNNTTTELTAGKSRILIVEDDESNARA